MLCAANAKPIHVSRSTRGRYMDTSCVSFNIALCWYVRCGEVLCVLLCGYVYVSVLLLFCVKSEKVRYFSIYACHPCAGAMLIFSVSFQFLRMTTEVVPTNTPVVTPISACTGRCFQNQKQTLNHGHTTHKLYSWHRMDRVSKIETTKGYKTL